MVPAVITSELTGAPSGKSPELGLRDVQTGLWAVVASTTDVVEDTTPTDGSTYRASRVPPTEGIYAAIWVLDGEEFEDPPVAVAADPPLVPPPAQLPTVDDVGMLLRGRTRDSDGRLQGVFTDTTEPTAAQVTDTIVDAAEEVASALPSPIPDAPGDDAEALRRAYRRVVALLAAMNIELAYPQDRGGYVRYDKLDARYKDALKRLIEAVAETGVGGGGESVESVAGLPLSNFGLDLLAGPRTVY